MAGHFHEKSGVIGITPLFSEYVIIQLAVKDVFVEK
jgi:hypothetical protein